LKKGGSKKRPHLPNILKGKKNLENEKGKLALDMKKRGGKKDRKEIQKLKQERGDSSILEKNEEAGE